MILGYISHNELTYVNYVILLCNNIIIMQVRASILQDYNDRYAVHFDQTNKLNSSPCPFYFLLFTVHCNLILKEVKMFLL